MFSSYCFPFEDTQMGFAPGLRSIALVSLLMTGAWGAGQDMPDAPGRVAAQSSSSAQTQTTTQTATPPAGNGTLKSRLQGSPESSSAKSSADAAEALRISKLAIVNGRPYDQPSAHDQFVDYLKDSYLLPAQGRNLVRTVYGQARDQPSGWGQDFPGFMQRYGAAAVTTVLVGNIRYGMENVFHEDLRYIPCHGCKVKKKIENALLAEITARHDEDGHRFFTLTPTVADFMGPIIAHSTPLYPDGIKPAAGAVSARLVFATRIGSHLFTEFVLERRHKDKRIDK